MRLWSELVDCTFYCFLHEQIAIKHPKISPAKPVKYVMSFVAPEIDNIAHIIIEVQTVTQAHQPLNLLSGPIVKYIE